MIRRPTKSYCKRYGYKEEYRIAAIFVTLHSLPLELRYSAWGLGYKEHLNYKPRLAQNHPRSHDWSFNLDHVQTLAVGTAKVQAEPNKCEKGLDMAAETLQELGACTLQKSPE